MNTMEMVVDSDSGPLPVVCQDQAEGTAALQDRKNEAAAADTGFPAVHPPPALQPPTVDPLEGRVLVARYLLGTCIGTGAMGAVYCAEDLQQERTCAVKVMHARAPLQNAEVIRFLDEARLLSRLCHPNVVEIYDSGETADGILFLVMELLSGHDLDTLLMRQPRLPLQQAMDIALQVASGLHTVHLSGIVHRDIKPRNIFLVPHEGNVPVPNTGSDSQRVSHYKVKIVDFGLAKTLTSQGRSRGSDGLLIGTPEYLPPEAWWGVSEHVDTRADQWALAVIVFRMLSGELPFECAEGTLLLGREIQQRPPRSLRALVPDLPVHVEEALTKALSKEKEGRFANMLDFMRALRRLPQSPPAPLIAGPLANMETLRVQGYQRPLWPTEELTPLLHVTQALKTEAPPTVLMRLPQNGMLSAASCKRQLVPHWLWAALMTAALIVCGAIAVQQQQRSTARTSIRKVLLAPSRATSGADTEHTLPAVQGAQHWAAPTATASHGVGPETGLPASDPRSRMAVPVSQCMPPNSAVRPLRVSERGRSRAAKGQI